MNVSVGIVGLPGVGKTALFNALTHRSTSGGGRSTMATVPVPDERLDVLASMFKPKRVVPAGVQMVDVAGLVKGGSQEGGLGGQFLGQLQSVTALAVVLRCFPRPDIGFGPEPAQPLADLETILLELQLSDLSRIDRRLERTSKAARGRDAVAQREEQTLQALRAALDAGKSARSAGVPEADTVSLKDLSLTTLKPMIFVANVAEGQLGALYDPDVPDETGVRSMLAGLQDAAEQNEAQVAVVSAQLEAELAELDEADAREYLSSLGVTDTGLSRFIGAAYRELGLLTYFTAGDPEARAWTVRQGARAPEAAGVIHSDIERGFIRAEVTPFAQLVEAGSAAKAKELGYTRLEGKDYVMQEGDVVYFRFNV
ncbi:MAG TPA: redox-regulated ATPase YchF [Chloroflexota bacterium]|nr:redox-regulated ATPase YchF [Chloroflexota bacterium]